MKCMGALLLAREAASQSQKTNGASKAARESCMPKFCFMRCHMQLHDIRTHPQVQKMVRTKQHSSVMMAYGISASGKTHTIEVSNSFQCIDLHVILACKTLSRETILEASMLLFAFQGLCWLKSYIDGAKWADSHGTSMREPVGQLWVLGSTPLQILT